MERLRADLGETITLQLLGASPYGLRIASMANWTGRILTADRERFRDLLQRPELQEAGVYILQGPDPENPSKMKAYVGEAENLRERLKVSAPLHPFWKTAAAIAGGGFLNKAHALYLEARIIRKAVEAGRYALANMQKPSPQGKKLTEAELSSTLAFYRDMRLILPMLGFDLLRSMPKVGANSGDQSAAAPKSMNAEQTAARFALHHKSGVKASAWERDGCFTVEKGAQAVKYGSFHKEFYAKKHIYAELKKDLLVKKILVSSNTDQNFYEFAEDHVFGKPSAASAVILDRSSNGRKEWRLAGSPKTTYAEWQEAQAEAKSAEDQQA